jgi:hypothetical protein
MNLPTQYELAMLAATTHKDGESVFNATHRAFEIWKACGSTVELQTMVKKTNERIKSQNLAEIEPLLLKGTAPYSLKDILKVVMPSKKTDDALAIYRDFVRWKFEPSDPTDKKQIEEHEKLVADEMERARKNLFPSKEAETEYIFLSRFVKDREKEVFSKRGQKGAAAKKNAVAKKITRRAPKDSKTPQAKRNRPQV